MKANRKTMLIAAFAVAVIALAGVGYAALGGYTAQTTSSGNDAQTKYITVKLSEREDDATCKTGTSVYTGQTVVVEYNTVTTNDTSITYTMKNEKITMSFNVVVEGTVNTANDVYKIKFTLPNVAIPGATPTWKWNGNAIESNEEITNQNITNLNGILSLELARTGSANTAPLYESTNVYPIGDIVVLITQTGTTA